ncbi:MAG TPA: galactokinase [Mycobacteriales bacterium]|jgi:galactokinase|nr:galactokinase [Mycobacteriales bacterium]
MTPGLQLAAEAVTALFGEHIGGTPDGVWAAPGRVNLIGEHTDYNDGFVLPLAIDRRAVVAVRPRADRVLRVHAAQAGTAEIALDDIAPGAVDGWLAYVAGPLWALAAKGVAVSGLDVVLSSDVPQGAGLSSSAAIECAVAVAAHELAGGGLSRADLALVAQRAEIEIAGVPCGIMDQMASMCATAGHALFLDTRSMQSDDVRLPVGADTGAALLVIDTRAEHSLVDGAYAERRAACEKAALILGVPALRDATPELLESAGADLDDVSRRRARHVVTENRRVLDTVDRLGKGSLAEIGPLLLASHESLRRDFEVTVDELDVAVESAMSAGAIGARMTGAGFGGCAIAVVAQERVAGCADAVAEAFAARGFTAPVCFVAEPSDGAGRIS